MWSLRILNGPQAGQTIPLREGDNIVGRGESCNILLSDPGISKQHAKISVRGNNISITDLNSSNGTFVNGAKVSAYILKKGDKVSLHKLLFDICNISMSNSLSNNLNAPVISSELGSNLSAPPLGQGTQNLQIEKSLFGTFNKYVESVVLPGVYKLGEVASFKWVLGCFILGFIILVTTLSVIPMLQIAKDGVEKESQKRARQIAKLMANEYRKSVNDNTTSTFSTRAFESEAGVKHALIVSSQDGSILFPASKVGLYKNIDFLHDARKEDRPIVEQISSDEIGAGYPIRVYKSDIDDYTPIAHAVVIYNMGSLAIDEGRTISLFVKVFSIALLLGGLLFFFMYKFIIFPIKDIDRQLDKALKNQTILTKTKYLFPELMKLSEKINSALSRMGEGGNQQSLSSFGSGGDKMGEADSLVNLFSEPAIAVNSGGQIVGVNNSFEQLTGRNRQEIVGGTLDSLSDQALQLNFEDLIENAKNSGSSHGQIEFSGVNHSINCQSIYGQSGPDYYILTVSQQMQEDFYES